MTILIHGTEYPDNWPIISHRAKQAANWKCLRCGRTEDPTNGISLGTYPWDHNPFNNNRDNLFVACNRCHPTFEAIWNHFTFNQRENITLISRGQQYLPGFSEPGFLKNYIARCTSLVLSREPGVQSSDHSASMS